MNSTRRELDVTFTARDKSVAATLDTEAEWGRKKKQQKLQSKNINCQRLNFDSTICYSIEFGCILSLKLIWIKKQEINRNKLKKSKGLQGIEQLVMGGGRRNWRGFGRACRVGKVRVEVWSWNWRGQLGERKGRRGVEDVLFNLVLALSMGLGNLYSLSHFKSDYLFLLFFFTLSTIL